MSKRTWPELWMSFAHEIAKQSNDLRLKVGCVIVPADNTGILSLGYNGDERGGSNKPDSMEPGESGFLHAEINALLKLDFNHHKQRIMYVTHFPCKVCCRAVVNGYVHRVVYDETYRDMSGREILLRSGVDVVQISEESNKRK